MNILDYDNRWIYKGSMTIPPCEEFVYWNVLQTIYPISEPLLDQFKQQMGRTNGLIDTGNYRLIQNQTELHNPHLI